MAMNEINRTNFFEIELDTQGPSKPEVSFKNGTTTTDTRVLNLIITSDSTDVYKMKIWEGGFSDEPTDDNDWKDYREEIQFTINDEEGVNKKICVRLMDDVLNESDITEFTFTYYSGIPVVNNLTIQSAKLKVSEKEPYNETKGYFFCTKDVDKIIFAIVQQPGDSYDNGQNKIITASAGSKIHVGDKDYSFGAESIDTIPAGTQINFTLKATDLKNAAGVSNKVCTVKVFAKSTLGDGNGFWSA